MSVENAAFSSRDFSNRNVPFFVVFISIIALQVVTLGQVDWIDIGVVVKSASGVSLAEVLVALRIAVDAVGDAYLVASGDGLA